MKFLDSSQLYNWTIGHNKNNKSIWRCKLCNKFMSCIDLVATLTTADWKKSPLPYRCPHCKKELLK